MEEEHGRSHLDKKRGLGKEAGKGMEEKMQNWGRRQEKGDNVQLIFQV